MILQPGQQIDRFIVERPLGEGGMAAVYLVRHITLDVVYALKILTIPSAAVRERMLREGRFQATLRHSNIVSVLDVLDIHGVLGLLMEYVDGPSLDEWLRAYRPSMPEAMAVFGGILSAVDMVHARGIIHRDLKPSNVLLHITDEGLYPRVTDFGIAKSNHFSDVTTGSGATVGTPAYMAPEQFRDASTVDQRADIFSLGAILYELVCGQQAFSSDNLLALMNAVARGEYVPPEQLYADIPDGMRAGIVGALRPDPDHRIPDCKRLAAVLTGQSAVHNIGDAMQRRLFLRAPGTVAAIQLQDHKLPSESATDPGLYSSYPPRPAGIPSDLRIATPVTYDEPIGAYSEGASQYGSRQVVVVQTTGASLVSVMILFLLLLTVGLLSAILVVWLSAAQSEAPATPAPVSAPQQGLEETVELQSVEPEPVGVPSAPAAVAAPVPQRRAEPQPPTAVAPIAEPAPSTPSAEIGRKRPAPSAADRVITVPGPPQMATIWVLTEIEVELRAGVRTVAVPGPVSPGDYIIRADFGQGMVDAGRVTVLAASELSIGCDDALRVCRAMR